MPTDSDDAGSSSLTDRVILELEAMLVRGDIGPGQRIAEAPLAARLGLSRAPVREACRALVQAGLLVSVRNRGMFVREVNAREIRDLYEIRSLIEGEMAAKFATQITRAQQTQLMSFVERMDKVAESEKGAAYYALNVQFHRYIAEHCDNRQMLDIYRNAVMRLHIYRLPRLTELRHRLESNQQHREIASAIVAGDAQRARDAMRHHILTGRERYAS
ncbi:GntR family transcriptional regulator [Burkholderia sp. WAC0059]|uniref:GntR family transcriptional regulator n=1 Tax=Burkholderia sp. WAC0059 TaxID=2066022 RepID=UPI0011AFC93B|nr:FCD domain-containing protein [Burkholderia sp. WAC0059]